MTESHRTDTQQKVALVTGSSTGIGAAVACGLAREDYHVWVNYASHQKKAQQVVESIEQAGGKAHTVCADIGSVDAIRKMFKTIREQSGRIDVLVNNAGVCPFIAWDKITEADWNRVHDINLRGAFFCSQEAGKLMVEKGIEGRIMVMSSISAIKGGTVQAHYCPTKGGMISMMSAFAVNLGPYGITCNSILPGTVETPINAEYLAVPNNRKQLEQSTCVGYIGQPRDVSGIVAFLARPEARYITGASILVDGGEYVKHL